MEVTRLLKGAREKKGVTQAAVGEAIGITAGAYSKIETGVNALDTQHILPLCLYLDIDVWKLLEACDEKEKPMSMKEKKNSCVKENKKKETVSWEEALGLEDDKEYKNTTILSKNHRLPGGYDDILVIGGCATGKTSRYVFPHLLQCYGSYIVVDSYGVLSKATVKFFEKNGYEIRIYDLKKMVVKDLFEEDLRIKEAEHGSPTAEILKTIVKTNEACKIKQGCVVKTREELKKEMDTIGIKPTILFIIPDMFEADTNKAFFSLIFKNLCETMLSFEHTVYLLLDEFASVVSGEDKEFLRLLKAKRQKPSEISISMISQSIGQLKALYKDSWREVVSRFNVLLCMGSPDVYTRQFLMDYMKEQEEYAPMCKEFCVNDLKYMNRNECLIAIKGGVPAFDTAYDPHNHPNYGSFEEALRCNKEEAFL